MHFRLVRTEYDRETARAYIELRTADADGGDAIATAIFSFRTNVGLSLTAARRRHLTKGSAPP